MVKPDHSRYVHVYMRSDEDKARWAALAENAKTPLSKWVIEIVESTLADNEEFSPRRELIKELDGLQKDNKALREDLRQKEIVLDRYETELRRFRSEPFMHTDFKGIRPYNDELVKILKARPQIDSYGLLEEMGIDPRDSDLVKAVSSQLEELEAYKLVETDGRSWKWIG